jgi:hypothetical protein
MTDPEERFAEVALARINKAMFALAAGGAIAALAWKGWTWGVGFLLGSVASWLNFRWLKHLVDTLAGVRPRRARVAIFAGLRYALLGGGAYVIFVYSPISKVATLAGLFVSVAAVIVEIIFQLVYARRTLDHQDLQ